MNLFLKKLSYRGLFCLQFLNRNILLILVKILLKLLKFNLFARICTCSMFNDKDFFSAIFETNCIHGFGKILVEIVEIFCTDLHSLFNGNRISCLQFSNRITYVILAQLLKFFARICT